SSRTATSPARTGPAFDLRGRSLTGNGGGVAAPGKGGGVAGNGGGVAVPGKGGGVCRGGIVSSTNGGTDGCCGGSASGIDGSGVRSWVKSRDGVPGGRQLEAGGGAPIGAGAAGPGGMDRADGVAAGAP